MADQPIRLSLPEIRACLENVRIWVKFISDALDNYDELSDETTLYSLAGDGTIVPRKTGGCPPPPAGSWSTDEDDKDDDKNKKKKDKRKAKRVR